MIRTSIQEVQHCRTLLLNQYFSPIRKPDLIRIWGKRTSQRAGAILGRKWDMESHIYKPHLQVLVSYCRALAAEELFLPAIPRQERSSYPA
jgi:hypothetical protein